MSQVKTPSSSTHRSQLPDITFKYRLLGMGLGGLPIAVVLAENAVPLPYWLWWVFSCYAWPWLALLRTRNNRDRFATECQNLLLDSFIAGTWVPLLHFNLLPSAMLIIITTADKISTGINGLWVRSLSFIAAGIAIGTVLTGAAYQPDTSMPVIMATLPIMGLHTLAVSYGTFRLIRRVSIQNRKLAIINQTDALTGLKSRGYWQQLADQLFNTRHDQFPFSMILIDIDDFKQINDSFGHSAGDEVLKAVAEKIEKNTPEHSISTRFGGDEFTIIVPVGSRRAQLITEAIRNAVAQVRIEGSPDLRCQISTGVSQVSAAHQDFRQWFDDADNRLYQNKAKNKGHKGKSVPLS